MSSAQPLGTVRLAVDVMGGDHGPSVTLPACRSFLDRHPTAELILVGTEAALATARTLAESEHEPAGLRVVG